MLILHTVYELNQLNYKHMKKFKFFPIVLGMLIVAFMASCTKDGVYNPKKKINMVYKASSEDYNGSHYETQRYLAEKWNWDNKTLSSIQFFNDGDYTENFTYDGNRLTRIDIYESSESMTIEYDGNYLKNANIIYRGKPEGTVSFVYNNKKLSELRITYYDAKSKHESRILASVLPFTSEVNETIVEFAEKAVATKGVSYVSYKCTWNGDNITQVMATWDDGDVLNLSITYDDKINPLKGFYGYGLEGDVMGIYSKNNPTQVMRTWVGEDPYIYTYNYQYDGDNYPTMVMISIHEEDYSYSYSTYYEYQ